MKLLVRDWRPRHLPKVGWSSGEIYCHKHGRGTSWPCGSESRVDRFLVKLGARSR